MIKEFAYGFGSYVQSPNSGTTPFRGMTVPASNDPDVGFLSYLETFSTGALEAMIAEDPNNILVQQVIDAREKLDR